MSDAMFSIGISFLFLMIIFGGLAAIVTIIVTAILSKRPWLVLGLGALGVFVLLSGGVMLALVGTQSYTNVHIPEPVAVSVGAHYVDAAPEIHYESAVSTEIGRPFVEGPKLNIRILLPILVLAGFGLAFAGRKWGRLPLWILLIVLVPLGLLASVRVTKSPATLSGRSSQVWSGSDAAIAEVELMPRKLADLKRQIEEQRATELKRVAAAKSDIERQKALLAKGAAAMQSDFHSRIAAMNFQQLVDEFYKSRISLSAEEEATQKTDIAADGTTVAAASKGPSQPESADASDNRVEKDSESKVAVNATDNRSKRERNANRRAKANSAKRDAAAKVAATEKIVGEASQELVAAVNGQPPADEKSAVGDESTGGRAVAVASENLPSWVHDLPRKTNDGWREVIVTEEYATRSECSRATQVYLLLKTYERLQNLIGVSSISPELPSLSFKNGMISADTGIIWRDSPPHWEDHRIVILESMGVSTEFVNDRIVKEQVLEQVERSFGPMEKLHTLIEFSPATDQELVRMWEARRRGERFFVVSTGALSVLGMLGMVFGLFKLDTWTKGYYTKRLFIGLPLGALGMILLYVALVEMGFDLPH